MDSDPTTAKLTEREKDALRGWLDRKTAKEIAIDLGISHHAVEKRLKMARVKLGVGSSLEAARILAQAEGYGQTVARTPDLPFALNPRKSWRHQSIVFGGVAMFLVTISLLILAPAHQSSPDDRGSAEIADIHIDGNPERLFDLLDQDDSGFLENPESPFVTVAFLDSDSTAVSEGKAVLGDSNDPEQLAKFYSLADTDSDGRISFREYHAWSRERLAELGIEVASVVKVLPTR
ncbi:MAG: LuxR C-terminal-related transcriptional regulator [Erythrobacter sp.]